MKSRPLALLTGSLTLGLGYWLAESSRDTREVWLAVGAWVLGFWFASNLLGEPRESTAEIGEFDDDEYEEYEDGEYEDEEEWEEEK